MEAKLEENMPCRFQLLQEVVQKEEVEEGRYTRSRSTVQKVKNKIIPESVMVELLRS